MAILLDLNEPMWVRQTRSEIEARRRAEAPFVYGDADLRIPEFDRALEESPVRYISDRLSLIPERSSNPKEGRNLAFPVNRLAFIQG